MSTDTAPAEALAASAATVTRQYREDLAALAAGDYAEGVTVAHVTMWAVTAGLLQLADALGVGILGWNRY